MKLDWATNELIDIINSDEGSYREMCRIINRASTMQCAADELKEVFGDMVAYDGTLIGKEADYIEVVKNETTPEDWDIDPWGDEDDED